MSRVQNAIGPFSNTPGFVPNVSTYAISQPYRAPSLNSHQYPQISSRNSHPAVSTGYGLGFNDDVFENYNAPTPHYMLPTQDTQSQLSTYGTQDLSRHWTPIAANNRASIGGLGFENDPSSRYGTSNFPYLNSSATASIAPDGSPFPGMNALARDLPRHGDRRLPNPARKSSAEMSANIYPSKSGESIPHGLPSGLSHKSSVAWRPESMTQGNSHGSVSSTSLSTVSSTGPVSSTTSVSPAETQPQSTAFGYIHLPHSPIQGGIPQASDVGSTSIATGHPSSLTDPSYSASHSFYPVSNHALSYDYTTGGMRGPTVHENLSSAGTLVSGARYQEPNYPPVLQRRPSQPLETESPPPNPPVQSTPITTTSTSHRRC